MCHQLFKSWSNDNWHTINNNNTGHFYGAWSPARAWAQCAIPKEAEKCINTYKGQNKKMSKVSGHMTANPHKNLHTAISVNKPKLSVTKHHQTLIWFWAHVYNITITSRYIVQIQKCTVGYCTHIHTQVYGGGGGGGGLLIIYRFEEMSF